jgi:hypothetical protein
VLIGGVFTTNLQRDIIGSCDRAFSKLNRCGLIKVVPFLQVLLLERRAIKSWVR